MDFLKTCLLNQSHSVLYSFLDLVDHCNFHSQAYWEFKYDFDDHSNQEIVDQICHDLIFQQFDKYENNKFVIMFIHLYYKIIIRRNVKELKYPTLKKNSLEPIINAIISNEDFMKYFRNLDIENLKISVDKTASMPTEERQQRWNNGFIDGYLMILDHLDGKVFQDKILYDLEYQM